MHTGQKRISPEVAAKLMNRMSSPELTCREMEVLRLVVTGLSNKEIGTTLYIGEGTVHAHINNILSKMGASDRTQAATLAIKRGLIRLE